MTGRVESSGLVANQTGHTVLLTVPDLDQAAAHLAQVVGLPAVLRPATDTCWIRPQPDVVIELRAGPPAGSPTIVDIGTQHLCWRVTDIDTAAAFLQDLPDTQVLGDIVATPDGPLAGNRWVYVRSPWGALFELQQWPDPPAYFATTSARLDHVIRPLPMAPLPGFGGLDHVGYSVSSLDGTLADLAARFDASTVLSIEMAVDKTFMDAQFRLPVEGTSKMAMANVRGLNVELFEHDLGPAAAPRELGETGGSGLVLAGASGVLTLAPYGIRLPADVPPEGLR